MEAIAAAGHVRVIGDAARARFDPLAIDPFEPIAEAHALRHRIAQCRVVEFERFLTVGQLDAAAERQVALAQDDPLDVDRRHEWAGCELRRIDADHAARARKQHAAVAAPPAGGLRHAVELPAAEPFLTIEHARRRERRRAVRDIQQIALIVADDAALAAHPQRSALIVENLQHAAGLDVVAHRQRERAIAAHEVKAAVERADPHVAAGDGHRRHVVGRQALRDRVGGERAVFHAVQAAFERPDPERAFGVFLNRGNVIRRQPLRAW